MAGKKYWDVMYTLRPSTAFCCRLIWLKTQCSSKHLPYFSHSLSSPCVAGTAYIYSWPVSGVEPNMTTTKKRVALLIYSVTVCPHPPSSFPWPSTSKTNLKLLPHTVQPPASSPFLYLSPPFWSPPCYLHDEVRCMYDLWMSLDGFLV